MIRITEEEFNSWQESIVTKALKERIKKDIQLMQDMLLTVSEDDLKNLQGRCAASFNLLQIEYEDLTE